MRKVYSLLLMLGLFLGSLTCAVDCATDADYFNFNDSTECQCCSLKLVVVKVEKSKPASAGLSVVLLLPPSLFVELPARIVFPIAFDLGLSGPGSAPFAGLFANRAPPVASA